jgi:hypothetical protein
MVDAVSVPVGAVPEGTVSVAEATKPDIAKMVEDAVAARLEPLKRGFQSEKDRAIAAAQRQADSARIRAERLEQELATADPDKARDYKLRSLEERVANDAAEKQAAEFDAAFRANVNESVTALGVDPSDKRIDWADDAPDYFTKQKRIFASAAKLQKESIASAVQAEVQKALKTVTPPVEDEPIENSVATTSPVGARGKRFYTVSELDDRDFRKANWEDIKLAQKEGRIKE